MDSLWLALVAWFGGVVAALLGWAQSEEPFVGRKFLASVLRSLFAGALWVLAADSSLKFAVWSALLAFVSGPGVDSLVRFGWNTLDRKVITPIMNNGDL